MTCSKVAHIQSPLPLPSVLLGKHHEDVQAFELFRELRLKHPDAKRMAFKSSGPQLGDGILADHDAVAHQASHLQGL